MDIIAFNETLRGYSKPETAGMNSICSKTIMMADIVDAVCIMFGFLPSQIKSKRRQRDLVRARHFCMYACVKLTSRNYSEIGRYFDRDHSTVMYAEQKMRDHTDPDDLKVWLETVKEIIMI